MASNVSNFHHRNHEIDSVNSYEETEYPAEVRFKTKKINLDIATTVVVKFIFSLIQFIHNSTMFRFIEPEVIIKEFSMEKLKAIKSHRYAKDTLSLICPVCDKQFQRNSHLKRHILIHTKEKVCVFFMQGNYNIIGRRQGIENRKNYNHSTCFSVS